MDLAQRIDAALPQTQCTRCGFPDCKAYAQAIAAGEAAINQCPPGGQEGVRRLAALTGRPELPLNPANGAELPRTVVWIDEAWCIGCTLCIKACPTDAVLGTNKQMHTVVEQFCTGCELCLPVCPVDCIRTENVTAEATGWQAWSQSLAETARDRYQLRSTRLIRGEREHQKKLQEKAMVKLGNLPEHSQHTNPVVLDQKRQVIEMALARAKARTLPAPKD